MKKAAIGLVAVFVVGILAFKLMPSGEDAASQVDPADSGDARQVTEVTAAATDQKLALDGANTQIDFSCSKTVAGKTLTVHGGWSGDFNSTLAGAALIDPIKKTVRSLTMDIDLGSLWSEHDMLTDAMKTKGFFLVDEYPTATFVSTAITEGVDPAVTLEGATHTVVGNFKLNNIEKSISFPAKLVVGDQALALTSAFSLNRKDFDVNFTDSAGFGLLTDDDIAHGVALKVAVDVKATEAVAADTGAEEVQEPAAAVDLASLPQTYTQTIPPLQVDFDLVLVPGDEAAGIPPLYVGAREVTWDEFMPWAVCDDVEDSDEHGKLRARKVRPSLPYDDITRGFGTDGFPALSMSRLSAELYCAWLSEQTGETFRLPTEEEWVHIYKAGGGSAEAAPENVDQVAIYDDNSEDEITGDYMTRQVGSMEPDALGIYDMGGNVCEWVLTDPPERVARGGHFESTADEIGVGRHVEDPEWNRNYPQEPKSIWWFVDARWVGFRVVREL